MRHLVRGLILAAVLGSVLPATQPLSAALICTEPGICSSTCDFCFSSADCPKVNGFRQSCICGGICP